MRLEEHYAAPASKLMDDYINGKNGIYHYFSYEPALEGFAERMRVLERHPVDRIKLSSIIRNYMDRYGLSEKALEQLQALEDGAPVVVTGQQAGLLTGPLYTVHKAISVIVLAKEASARLNRKVVPVFWIAGEDHDLAEISHLYREVSGRVDKLNFPHAEYGKSSASSAKLNKTKVTAYLEEYFRSLPETEHSKELHQLAFQFLEASESFTDFFSAFINYFFQEEGLLFIDAAFPELRQYESAYFLKMIEKSEAIADAVLHTEQKLAEQGYSAAIEAEADAANLFITVQGERILLQRSNGRFAGNNGAVDFSAEELKEIAEKHPERLSNNVVTRPLMQEMVFPVLAFVGGPGEISYWAALKDAFKVMGMEMPVILPRLGMTLVNRRVQSLMAKYQLSFEEIVNEKKVADLKIQLMDAIRDEEAEAMVEGVKTMLQSEYETIREKFSSVSKGLSPVVEKNLQFHLKQLDFLKNKLEDEVMLQNSIQFTRFGILENELIPNNSLQERVYSPFPYMNEHGKSLVQEIMKLNLEYDKNHKIIYM